MFRLFILLILFGGSLAAQQTRFQLRATPPGNLVYEEYGNAVPLADGGYAVIHQVTLNLTSTFASETYPFFMRYAHDGTLLVARRYSRYLYSSPYLSMSSTRDDGFLIVGNVPDSLTNPTLVPNNVTLVKTDSVGAIVWKKAYRIGTTTGGFGVCAKQLPDGGFIVSGGDYNQSSGYDALLMRTDSVGNVIWSRTYNSYSDDLLLDIELLPDGGFLFAGHGGASAGLYDMVVMRTDSLGALVWFREFVNTGTEVANSVALLANGDIAIAGYTDDNMGNQGATVARLDNSGNVLWQRCYQQQGPFRTAALSVDELPDQRLVLGINYEIPNFQTVWATGRLVLEPNGDFNSLRLYGDSSGGRLTNAGKAPDGGSWLMGRRYESVAPFGVLVTDFSLIKTDTAGSSGCDERVATLPEVPFPSTYITNCLHYQPAITSYDPTMSSLLDSLPTTVICFEKAIAPPPFPAAIPEPVSLPNVFSPNGDGVNDVFVPFNADNVRYRMRIYNRWGNLLATLDNTSWDGRDAQGTAVSDGTYYYVCEAEERIFTGFLTLLRQ